MPEDTIEIEPENIAAQLYAKYCDAVGGKAFNGDNLPMWAEFRADPAKEVQSDAWVAVAQRAIEIFGLDLE
jgi:hypothetical protein